MPCTVFIFPCADFMYFVLKCPICHLFNTLRIFCVIYHTLNLYNFCQPREPKSAVFHYSMMTPSYGNIFSVTGPLWGEFTGHQWFPLTKASDAELWCFLSSGPNKRLSKQLRHRWFETPLRSLWRNCYANNVISLVDDNTGFIVTYTILNYTTWSKWLATLCLYITVSWGPISRYIKLVSFLHDHPYECTWSYRNLPKLITTSWHYSLFHIPH